MDDPWAGDTYSRVVRRRKESDVHDRIDNRRPWTKLTNLAAAAMAAGQVAAMIWPAHAAICHGVVGVALALLGVGIARRVARFGEANGK